MSKEERILPPGKPISKENVTVEKLDASINFSYNSASVIPLSPIVQTSYKGKVLQVSAIVFIPSLIEEPNFSIVSKKRISLYSGKNQLNLYIAYCYEEVSSQNFDAYRVDIIIKKLPRNLDKIQTFLWNEDPVTSRGTVTEVEGR
ncbi:hypothetical protein QLS71_004265 [Mariniflexile litorale]|uniref:Uncharacterized protein n=1 Tax=Mariniflexile litorale TaxID=3045158 RepID=A0AAU7EJA5_9FLAO|nr:hypothetical protein [Mariniflexile sp. KMM 9835]MDQ8210233.1 hypothetical protein [Mariniflexile sp. KMM 9835]